ncbi:Uncharacterised protein [Klebsiella pneumoniae]|nr:Uncharacterised protein [Klebsiella pneumoniae]
MLLIVESDLILLTQAVKQLAQYLAELHVNGLQLRLGLQIFRMLWPVMLSGFREITPGLDERNA